MPPIEDSVLSQAVEVLSSLIRIPSPSRDEGAAADCYAAFLAAQGFTVSRLHNNLWIFPDDYDASRPTVLLNSHIDTVRPVPAWQRDPFTPTREADRLYGLGSNDAGASLVSLFFAYRELVRRPQPYNLIYSVSAEEEVSGRDGCLALMGALPPVTLAIVGEPTSLQMAVAEKGLLVLDCTAHGRSGHAARGEGDNALYHALDDIQALRSHRFARVSPTLGAVGLNVTMISCGSQHNVIPDACTFVVDVRPNDCYSNLELLDEIRALVSSDVVPRSVDKNSSHIDLTHPVVRRGLSMGLTAFGSPTSSDQMRIPYPSLKIGPGESSRSHTADEFICLDEIAAGIRTYVDLLDGLQL